MGGVDGKLNMCCTNPVITTDLEVNNDTKKNNVQNLLILGNNQVNTKENNGGIENQNTKGSEVLPVSSHLNLKEFQVSKLDINQKKNFLRDIVDIAPKMSLKVINSLTLVRGANIALNCQGIIEGLRKAFDGISYFGSKKRSGKQKEFTKAEIINDFVIPLKEKEAAERYRGRHFQIEYKIDKEAYFLRDLGIGLGAFLKLDDPHNLKDNNMIGMGESYIIINIIEGDKMEDKKIRLKLFAGPNNEESYYFNSLTEKVMIGRENDCDIKIDDPLLSKHQATIIYNENSGWILFDGINNKKSTNGTWLFASEDLLLKDKSYFKGGQSLFQVSILV